MVTLFIVLAIINFLGVIVCHSVARSRGSRNVVFWTTMGVLFGPCAIPFALKFARAADSGEARVSA